MKRPVHERRALLTVRRARSSFQLATLLFVLPFCILCCNQKEKKELSEDEKQARVEALLKASGAEVPAEGEVDVEKKGKLADSDATQGSDRPEGTSTEEDKPSSADEPDSPSAQTAKPGSDEPAPSSTGTGADSERTLVKLLNAGNGPKRILRYNFVPGRKRNFSMDLEIAPSRKINGQDAPGMPPMALAVTGTTQTLSFQGGLAERRYTFANVVPSVTGLPPEVASQVASQFQGLKGIELGEKVTNTGKVEDLALGQASMSPQVLALMQYLTDGMTNAFLPLPQEPVGVGAKWVASTQVESAGLNVTQENTIQLTGLSGDTVTVELSYVQSAPSQEVKSPNLPPGVKVEIMKLDGSGTGKMIANLKNFTVDSKIDVSMQVDTRVTEPGAPGPLTESGRTKMRAHVRVTE